MSSLTRIGVPDAATATHPAAVDLVEMTVTQAQAAFSGIMSEALTQAFLGRIAEFKPAYNAIIRAWCIIGSNDFSCLSFVKAPFAPQISPDRIATSLLYPQLRTLIILATFT